MTVPALAVIYSAMRYLMVAVTRGNIAVFAEHSQNHTCYLAHLVVSLS